jgi:hypothetical protein
VWGKNKDRNNLTDSKTGHLDEKQGDVIQRYIKSRPPIYMHNAKNKRLNLVMVTINIKMWISLTMWC